MNKEAAHDDPRSHTPCKAQLLVVLQATHLAYKGTQLLLHGFVFHIPQSLWHAPVTWEYIKWGSNNNYELLALQEDDAVPPSSNMATLAIITIQVEFYLPWFLCGGCTPCFLGHCELQLFGYHPHSFLTRNTESWSRTRPSV